MVSKAQLIAMEFFNSASFAYLFSGINWAILKLYEQEQYVGNTVITENDTIVSLITLAFILGQTLSCFTVPLARKFWSIKGSAIFFNICLIISIAAVFIPVHWAYLMAFRFIQGICQMSNTSLANIWIAMYDESINKFYSPFISTNIAINYALSFITLERSELWSLSQLYGLVTAIVLFGLILATPLKNQEKPWERVVELQETIETEQKKEENQENWYKLVSKKDLMIIQIFLGISSQITGISNAVNFATLVFEDVFHMLTPFQSSFVGAIIMAVCKSVASFLCIVMTKKVKVVYAYSVGLGVTVIANVIQAVSFPYRPKSDAEDYVNPDQTTYMSLVLFSAVLFIIAFELSAGCLQFYINGVVSTFGNSTMLSSLMFGVWSATNMVVCFTYKYFTEFYWVIYMLYAILTIISTAVMIIFIVKNKPLVAALDKHDN